jgi:Zn-dependent peptidase ImmA (M78 family)
VVLGGAAIIVVNDGHSRARQANSITHELAHLLLGHEPVPAFVGPGVRTLTKLDEDEADWLAGCLLVPKSGVREVMRACGDDLIVAAAHYGVSVELMRWRHNVTSYRRRSRRA